MTDFYSQNRCVCSTRSHGPLLCAFCLSFHFKDAVQAHSNLRTSAVLRLECSLDCVSGSVGHQHHSYRLLYHSQRFL